MTVSSDPVAITVADGEGPVSGLLLRPAGASRLYVLAHGAGAGMRHPFLEAIARALAERDVATLRYQFPYMERRASPPHPPPGAAAAGGAAPAQTPRASAGGALPPRGQAVRGGGGGPPPAGGAPPPL